MDAQLKLAVLDHKNNVGRKQATMENEWQGEKRCKYVSSKLNKNWLVKPKKWNQNPTNFLHII